MQRLFIHKRLFIAVFFLFVFTLLMCTPFSLLAQTETKSHVSSDKIFIVTYPAKWKINKFEQNAELAVNAPEGSLFKPCMVKMEISKLAEGYEKFTIRELSEVELKMMKAQSDESVKLEILESAFKTVKNKEWWIIKGKLTKKKEIFFTNSYKSIHNGKVYILTYFSTEKNFEKNTDAAYKIFESIEFLTKDESVNNIIKPEPNNKTVKNTVPAKTIEKPKPIANPNETVPGNTPGQTGKITFTYTSKKVTYTTVRAADGNVWLQQSLGSKAVATEANDENAWGDLFQWGRWADGHHVRKPANTRHVEASPNNPVALSKTGANPFYYDVVSMWWVSGETTDTWQAATPAEATATNGCDPCRAMGNGWRLPTKAEWETLKNKEFITDFNGAFISNLKLSNEGYRDAQTAFLNDFKVVGAYWTNSPSESDGGSAIGYSFYNNESALRYTRGTGLSIRCIKGSK